VTGWNETHQPRRPRRISEYALACLEALGARRLGRKISLGGALGLAHYYEYRSTHDVDAWWMPEATEADRQRVIQVVQEVLHPYGSVSVRSWGDVVSVELKPEGQRVFSFQIAHRSAQLEPSRPAPWVTVLLDSLEDLVASKMVALVERGAPRDFLDIYTLCQANVMTPAQSWALWRKRQQRAGNDTDANRACLAVQTHLARIAAHRPLGQILDSADQEAARQMRAWFKKEFLDALIVD
jgi:hypothetical protein